MTPPDRATYCLAPCQATMRVGYIQIAMVAAAVTVSAAQRTTVPFQ